MPIRYVCKDRSGSDRIALPDGVTPRDLFKEIRKIEVETGEEFNPPEPNGMLTFRTFYTDTQWGMVRQAVRRLAY